MDEERDLILDPLTVSEIEELVVLAGGVDSLLSKKSPKYKEYQDQVHEPKDWIPLMAQEPRLLKRPLLRDRERLLIGFDLDTWSALIAGNP